MAGFLGDVASILMTPFDFAVSAALLAWHEIFALALDGSSGWAWALAIVGMTVTIRVLMMPLYLRQMHVRREMRQLDPQIRALQETYGHDPDLLMKEQMKLLRAAGIKPFLSFLPLVLLGVLLLALFRIIDASSKYAPADGSFRRGFVTEAEALSLSQAKILDARIADSFLGPSHAATEVLAVALTVVMCLTHVIAQRQEAAQIPPDAALPGPTEQKQQFLLYALLVVLVAFGLVLPVGALIFWATSKVWTVGQQRMLRDYPGSS